MHFCDAGCFTKGRAASPVGRLDEEPMHIRRLAPRECPAAPAGAGLSVAATVLGASKLMSASVSAVLSCSPGMRRSTSGRLLVRIVRAARPDAHCCSGDADYEITRDWIP